jgi:hypothetical protein
VAAKALHHALELAEQPAIAGMMRKQPLPADVVTLIRIAANSEDDLSSAVTRTGRPAEFIRSAATLYLQQVLLHPSADAYRTLGVTPGAAQEELSQHMRLLMKWLHPDRDRGDWESAFAERVSGAWDKLKTPERRAQYDLDHPVAPQRSDSRRRRSSQRRPADGSGGRRPNAHSSRRLAAGSPINSVAVLSAGAALLYIALVAVFFLIPVRPGTVAGPSTAATVDGNDRN